MSYLRYKYVLLTGAPYVALVLPRLRYILRHPERYTEAERHAAAIRVIDRVRRCARVTTLAYGQENLPAAGGCMLCANHQGKYDALGILLSHPAPCAVLWEAHAADYILSREIVGLLQAQTIDLEDPRDSLRAIRQITRELSEGRRYLIFPEGGYTDNHNTLQEFKHGCFRCAEKSGVPIVPVAIWDSWRAMDTDTLERVTTQVHFLPPIPRSEYAGLKRPEIAELVKSRIAEKLRELEAAAGSA